MIKNYVIIFTYICFCHGESQRCTSFDYFSVKTSVKCNDVNSNNNNKKKKTNNDNSYNDDDNYGNDIKL